MPRTRLCSPLTITLLLLVASAEARAEDRAPCFRGFRHVETAITRDASVRKRLFTGKETDGKSCIRFAPPKLVKTSAKALPALICPDHHVAVDLATLDLSSLAPFHPPKLRTTTHTLTCAATLLPDSSQANRRWEPVATKTHQLNHRILLWPKARFRGGTFMTETAEKLADCKRTCARAARCMFATFNPERKRCYLAPWPIHAGHDDTRTALIKVRRAKPGADLWIAPSHGKWLFRLKPNTPCLRKPDSARAVALPPDVPFAHVHDAATCASVCASTKRCARFLWAPDPGHPEGGTCHLLSKKLPPSALAPKRSTCTAGKRPGTP